MLRQLAARRPRHYPLLLDSAAAGPLSGTSLLLAAPSAALWLDRDGRLGAQGMTPRGAGFLAALENWWRSERSPAAGGEGDAGRFCSGWAVFLGYELAGEIEPHLVLPKAPFPWQAFALRTHGALVLDLKSSRVFAVAEEAAVLGRLVADATEAARAMDPPERLCIDSVREEDPASYLWRVCRAKDYVRAGDIYQANLSRPWDVRIRPAETAGSGVDDAAPPLVAALYERLRAANPAPFAALAQWQGVAILSSSPERLVRVDGQRVDTRPIAGTRPRSRDPARERGEMSELAAHPKERAEHIMLIDLERNDLGRVCVPGSVVVDELMSVESYAHVHHIVSNVRGRLRDGVTPGQAIAAVFPGGTITGCPKVRCMQIIAELEGCGRGAYTGALGYLDASGDLDLNILIRTLTLRGDGVRLRAGAGIVADSDALRELDETRIKARGLLRALGVQD